MDKQDIEVIESLSEPAKKLFYSLDRNSQKRILKNTNVSESVCGFITAHTLFFLLLKWFVYIGSGITKDRNGLVWQG